MIPPGLVHYSIGQLEDIAAQTFRRRPDVELSAPINVELLIEHMPDVRLKLRRGLRREHHCEGCVCKQSFTKRLTVLIDAGVFGGPWATYNAVLAEEFAHITLHPALFLFVETPDDFVALQRDREWKRFEQDARKFSLAIRMPECLLTREADPAYSWIVDEYGFGDPDLIERLLVNRLAERFRVDPDEAYRRLTSYPCDIRDRLYNSIQSRSLALLPSTYVVFARASRRQLTFLDEK